MTDILRTKRSDAPSALPEDLACTLTPSELEAQRDQLLPGLVRRAKKVEDIPNGVRFCFAHEPGFVTELAAVIEREQTCCGFLRFRLTADPSQGEIALEVSGPPGTAEMLKKL